MKTLIQLQELDREIDACRAREDEIPKQKNKFDADRKRLEAELNECEENVTRLTLEQRAAEGDIELKQEQIAKYQAQLATIRNNDEYTALIHEIDRHKKQIGVHEERIINILVEIDEAKERFVEDKKRIDNEVAQIDAQCAEIDAELGVAISHRKELEAQREPMEEKVEKGLLSKYQRIRKNKPDGIAIVPMNGDACGGCHMHERAQIVNEVLEGTKILACQHCGRLLYHPPNFEKAAETQEASS